MWGDKSFEELEKDKDKILRKLWGEDFNELKGKTLIKLLKDREKEIKRKEKKEESKEKI